MWHPKNVHLTQYKNYIWLNINPDFRMFFCRFLIPLGVYVMQWDMVYCMSHSSWNRVVSMELASSGVEYLVLLMNEDWKFYDFNRSAALGVTLSAIDCALLKFWSHLMVQWVAFFIIFSTLSSATRKQPHLWPDDFHTYLCWENCRAEGEGKESLGVFSERFINIWHLHH